MAINKIVLNTDDGEQVLVDLTGDNVKADALVVGHTAHGADGEPVEGANPYELETTDAEVQTQSDLIEQIQTALVGKAAGGGINPAGTIEITSNGTHDVTSYATAEVNVPDIPAVIQPLEVTANGTYTAPHGVDGYSPVVVAVPEREITLQDKEITENGSYTADDGYDGLGTVVVNVESAGGGVIVEGIPDGYAKVDYIQFDGRASVDTGIICNQGTKIVVRFTRDGSAAQYLYGVVNADNTASVTAYLSSGGSWRFGSKSASRTVAADEQIIRTAIVQKTGIVSDAGTSNYSGVTDFETPNTLILGGCRYSSGSIGVGFVGKVLGFEVWQDSVLVQKLMPVVNAGGEYRFWDKAGQRFFDTVQGVPLTGGNL